MKIFRVVLLVLSFMLAGQTILFAQADRRAQLEKKRQLLKQEISQINTLITSNQAEKKSILTIAEDLDRKIKATEQLIRLNNQEANLLTQEINSNQNKIGVLRKELEELKDDYAKMVQKSYKGHSKQSRLMFLFSSDDFHQAYKRLQYMKQYANYRASQGEKIKEQTQELQDLNIQLSAQKKDKEKLLAENRETQNRLKKDKQEQEALIATINKKGREYQQQIKNRQAQISQIDAEIQKMIRDAIAAENKKRGSTKTNTFTLTPEARALATSFENNRGKLPWPLKSGNITMPFGEHPSPIAKNVTVQSNGIRIETNSKEPILSIFKGKVLEIQVIRGANKTVMIQHGNYISVYRNLENVYVQRGQEVQTGHVIGQVGTSRDTHRPTLNFYIFKDTRYLDPMGWIIRR